MKTLDSQEPMPISGATDVKTASVPVQAQRGVNERGINVSTMYLTLYMVSLVAIEMDLPRFGNDRRVNFPIFILISTALIVPAIRNTLSTRNFNVRLVTLCMVGYVGWSLLTCLWSPIRSESLFHASILMLGLFLAKSGMRYSVQHTIKLFCNLSIVIFAASWVALLVAPHFALQQKGIWRLSGIMDHEFRLGYIAAANCIICTIWACCKNPTERPPTLQLVLLGLISVVTLLATQTRTLLVYTLICVCIIGFVHLNRLARIGFTILFLLMATTALIFSNTILDSMSRGDGDATLSGRTMVWERSLSMYQDHPFLGHGFASFTAPDFDHVWHGYRPPHAHNTWIMALFETGIPGTVLLTLMLVLMLVQSARTMRILNRPSYAFYLTLLCVFAGATGLIFGGKLTTLMGLCMLLFFQEQRERFFVNLLARPPTPPKPI